MKSRGYHNHARYLKKPVGQNQLRADGSVIWANFNTSDYICYDPNLAGFMAGKKGR